MLYSLILVDDEMPALRYMQNIVEKYAPNFKIVNSSPSGEKALEYLKEHPVDLLITDISMHGIDGVDLSLQARALYPNIHIIIISGYAQFDYAQGAIQASVDEYLLKPVSVTQVRAVLDRVKEHLGEEYIERMAKLLPAIACDPVFTPENASSLFDGEYFRFALVRFGNLNFRLPETLNATSLIQPPNPNFFALRGRDDDEQLLLFPEQGLETFLTGISVFMSQHASMPTWTVIYHSAAQPITMLPSFICKAIPQLQRQCIIGRHQMLALLNSLPEESVPHMPPAELRQMTYFVTSGKTGNLKDMFLSLSGDWESGKLHQLDAWVLVRQIARHLAASVSTLDAHLDGVLNEITDLFLYASSYGDLLANIYAVLLDDNTSKDKKMSTRELYDYAVHYIDEHYTEPLSMQSVCEEIGISQTYLSRLFRKYSDTTFNVYLTRHRMEAAMQLLQERPNILLRDVAACVGYEDSSYFSKVFHQYSGLTPSQFSMRRK